MQTSTLMRSAERGRQFVPYAARPSNKLLPFLAQDRTAQRGCASLLCTEQPPVQQQARAPYTSSHDHKFTSILGAMPGAASQEG